MVYEVEKKGYKMLVLLVFIFAMTFGIPNHVSAMSSNLIVNGDFEDDPNFSGSWNSHILYGDCDFIWDGNVYHRAYSHSIKLVGNATYAALSKGVTVEPNKIYNISAWCKGQNITTVNHETGAVLSIVQLDSNDDIIESTLKSFDYGGSFDWSNIDYNIITNTNAVKLFISLGLDGSGTVWYDDVSLTLTSLEIPSALPPLAAVPGLDRSTFKGFHVLLDASASVGAKNYKWRIVSKPNGSQIILNNSNSINADFTPDVTGDYILGLTVSDGAASSPEVCKRIRVKNLNDTSDDMSYCQMLNFKSIDGYTADSLVPLADGWVILGDRNKNKVVIMNGITGEVAKEYQLGATPTQIDFDFDKHIIIATQEGQSKIAKIDVDSDQVNYIEISNTVEAITFGEGNLAFVLTKKRFSDNQVSIIDLLNNKELLVNPIDEVDIGLMKYDRVHHNLFLAHTGLSPSSLYKYSFDMQSNKLSFVQSVWDAGTNGEDLSISNDGLHLAFACGGGNDILYKIADFSTSDLTRNNGNWDIGAYPTSADFSYDNNYIAATKGDEIKLFDVLTHTVIRKISSMSSDFLRFSRGSSIIFSLNAGQINLNKSFIADDPDPVTLNHADVDNMSPITTGEDVNFTVDASGGLKKQYGLLVYDGSTWTTLQSYSDNNILTWKPTQAGSYTLAIEVKDINSDNKYDDIYVIDYVVHDPVGDPTTNISSGEVSYGTSIKLSTSTEKANIYYTLDGSTPTDASTLYTDPIILTKATTIKAIAIDGDNSSSVAVFNYTIAANVAVPTVDVSGGAVIVGTQIALTSSTSGAAIYFTIDGSTPTRSSNMYLNKITITNPITLKAIAVKAGMSDSPVMSVSYTITNGGVPDVHNPVSSPIPNVSPGEVPYGTSIKLSTSTEKANIYYTLDGSTPTDTSTLYADPIILTNATTIKAIAIDGGDSSSVAVFNYTITANVAVPTVDVSGGAVIAGTQIALTSSTSGAAIYFTIDGSTPTRSSNMYLNKITITNPIILKAIAVKAGMSDSPVMSVSYTIANGGVPDVHNPVGSPTPNVSSGEVPYGTSIKLSTSTEKANIYYTLDGSTPTDASTLYTGPIVLTKATTIKAIAIDGGDSSSIAIFNYTITANVAVPKVDVAGGAVIAGTQIALTSATTGATIYYTTDGTTPSRSSNMYLSKILITNPITLKAIAVKTGMSDSSVMSVSYIITNGASNGSGGISSGNAGGGSPSGGGGMPSGGGGALLPGGTSTDTNDKKEDDKSKVIKDDVVLPGIAKDVKMTLTNNKDEGKLEVDYSLPTSEILKQADQEGTVQNPLQVNLSLSTNSLLEQMQNSEIKNIDMSVTIPKDLTNNKKVEINGIIDKDIIEKAKDSEKNISIKVVDDKGKEQYSWTFEGSDLRNSQNNISDVNISLHIETPTDNEELSKLLNADSKDDTDTHGLLINFSHEGPLPAKANVRIYVGDQEGLKPGSKLFLYHYNEETGKLDVLPNTSECFVDAEGYVSINILHCSDYVILTNQANEKSITKLEDQITVTPLKKTLYIGNGKAATVQIKVILPDTLQLSNLISDTTSNSAMEAVDISYYSNDNKVATVNGKGLITGKSKGTATLKITIKLHNGSKKIIKVSVKVK